MAETIRVIQGGKLRSAFSHDNVGQANYVRKINWRRVLDREKRREGWPLAHFNSGLPASPQALGIPGLVKVAEVVRPNQERALLAATKMTIYRFNYNSGEWSIIGSGFSPSGRRWQTVEINGTIIFNNAVDIPQSYRVENATVEPLYELRENGVARVGHIAECGGFLCLADITYIIQANLAAHMAGPSPWGTPDPSITQRVPYDFSWSEFSQPTRFATSFTVEMSAASTTLTLPWATKALKTGDLVAVINGGPANGVLGGQTGYENGVPITVAGNTITLATPTASGIGYPRKVTVMRWTDQSTIVGKRSLQGDGSPIIAMLKLDKQLVLYRASGIFTARYTGIKEAPWAVEERQGKEVPSSPDCVITVNGDYHVYPGITIDESGQERGQFFRFNGVEPPKVFTTLDDCSNLWFEDLEDPLDCFAVDNPVTKEVWFCRPGRVLALCYESGGMSASEIDATITAAAFVHKPGFNSKQFVLVDGNHICTYGGGTYLRKGLPASAPTIKFGLHSFGDEHNEKDVTAYVPLFSSTSPNVQMDVTLWASQNANANGVELFSQTLTDPAVDNSIHCFFRSIYFQDQIQMTDTRDINAEFTGRIFEVQGGVRSRSSMRNA